METSNGLTPWGNIHSFHTKNKCENLKQHQCTNIVIEISSQSNTWMLASWSCWKRFVRVFVFFVVIYHGSHFFVWGRVIFRGRRSPTTIWIRLPAGCCDNHHYFNVGILCCSEPNAYLCNTKYYVKLVSLNAVLARRLTLFMIRTAIQISTRGVARIWTAIAGVRVQSANRYTTKPIEQF